MIYLISVLCGAIAGSLLTYCIIKPKLNRVIELNENIQQMNQTAELQLEEAKLAYAGWQEDISKAKRELELTEFDIDKKRIELNGLKNEAIMAENNISSLKTQAEESAKLFYDQSMALTSEKLDRALETKAQEIQQSQEDYLKEYSQILEDCVKEFKEKTSLSKKELDSLTSTLEDLRARVNAAVEASRRAEEMASAQNFYKLNIPVEDLEEIAKLRSILSDLRNPEPLNKVIWKVYYEKPYTDLVGRVVGTGVKTGIYKITNIENQKCYIGQAADLASRWRQHIKRGIGAEAPTRNKLYPAMLSIGVENFTFEVVEECSRAQLNEREDYWQEYFHAIDYGYSIK